RPRKRRPPAYPSRWQPWVGSCRRRDPRKSGRGISWPGGLPDRPHLDAAPLGRRNPRRDLKRVVQILGVDEVEAAQLLFGLGVGTVGGGQLAVADAHGRG